MSPMDSSRQRTSSGPLMYSGNYARQKNLIPNDPSTKDSVFMGQLGGSSSKRASGRKALAGSEFDLQCSRTTDASSGMMHRHLSQHRYPIEPSSESTQAISERNSKNYEAALKGIVGLQFESDERNHY